MERSVRINDLISYFGLSTVHNTAAGGLSYAMATKKWKAWLCPLCADKFSVSEHIWGHVLMKHLGDSSHLFENIFPRGMSSSWAEKISSNTWKPVDALAAFKMLEETGVGETIDNWPLLDDTNREGLLGKIREKFDFLIEHRHLSASHIKKVIRFSMHEANQLGVGVQHRNFSLDGSPLWICFLEPTQLGKILEFLSDLSSTVCDLRKEVEESINSMFKFYQITETQIEEVIAFSEDGLSLSLIAAKITGETSALRDRNQIDLLLDRLFKNKLEGARLVSVLKDMFGKLKNEESVSLELSDDDKRILREVAIIEGLKDELELGSIIDYQAILLLELKIYLQRIEQEKIIEGLEQQKTEMQRRLLLFLEEREKAVQHLIRVKEKTEGFRKDVSKLGQTAEIKRLESGVSKKGDKRRIISKNKRAVEELMNGRRAKLSGLQIILEGLKQEIGDVRAEITKVRVEISNDESEISRLEEALRIIDEEIKGDLDEIAEKRVQIAN